MEKDKKERSIDEFIEKLTTITGYYDHNTGIKVEEEMLESFNRTLQAERQKCDEVVEESRVSLLFLAEKVLKEINNTYAIDIKHADKKQWLEPGEFERIFLHRFNDAGIEALTQPNNLE